MVPFRHGIGPATAFSRPAPAQCPRVQGGMGLGASLSVYLPTKRRLASLEVLVNPELLGCHLGSCNAVRDFLERNIPGIVRGAVIGLHFHAEW
jgi:hypothetical protein